MLFLEYVVEKLRIGRSMGVSLDNLASDYKADMGTALDRQELNEFMFLYENWFELDGRRLKLSNKAKEKLREQGSIKNYLNQQGNQSSSKQPKPKSIIYRLAKNPIIQIMSVFVIVYSFLKAIEAIFNIDIPFI